MCAACGPPAAAGHWSEAGVGASAHESLRARIRRLEVLKAVLPAYGLTAHDGMQVPGIQVAAMTGGEVIVADLTELWAAALVLGQRIDPLDLRFLGESERAPAEPT